LIGTAEAAERNGISIRYLQRLCQDGRVRGAQRIGRDWLVPASFTWKPLTRGPKPKSKK
jgi:predicted site-specific integrase-resolvase